MKRILEVCLLTLVCVTSVAFTQPARAGDSFPGTWKGTMNGLPGIDLTIQEAGNQVSGEAVFYFQERADVNSPWRITAEHAVPLLKPHVDGKTLTFEVEHHVCHGCKELGPNVTFRMELAGANEARLARLEEDGTEGPQMKLVRSTRASTQAAPPLQRGITVEMPVTENASPAPGADQPDALIVTVRDDGSVYLGVNSIALEALTGELQSRLVGRAEKQLYVKADARAPYAAVMNILDAATAAGSDKAVLLTFQHDSPEPGTLVPPKGFSVVIGECKTKGRSKLSL